LSTSYFLIPLSPCNTYFSVNVPLPIPYLYLVGILLAFVPKMQCIIQF
jgi:hypothetical protein